MDPQLLDYFNRELAYLREAGSEFAAAHPKIARRLGMHGTEVDDPYVERLIESFGFMSARVQIKLDAEFPRFTERLLEVLYPNYLCPTPSMAVARLFPAGSNGGGNDMSAFRVARDSVFTAQAAPGEQTACRFRSSQDVTLWPVEIVEARLTGTPPDLADAVRRLPPHVRVAGALRLRLRLTRVPGTFASLKGLDELPVYLSGGEALASQLFELLHTSAVGTVTGVPGALAQQSKLVSDGALVHEALEPGQGLLPLQWNTFHGHNLLHEFFACPQRFWFFRLTGLRAGLALVDGPEAEVVVLLSRPPGALQPLVDAAQFALFCTPVINLFEAQGAHVAVAAAQSELHLVSHANQPLDFEVHSVQSLTEPADNQPRPALPGAAQRCVRPEPVGWCAGLRHRADPRAFHPSCAVCAEGAVVAADPATGFQPPAPCRSAATRGCIGPARHAQVVRRPERQGRLAADRQSGRLIAALGDTALAGPRAVAVRARRRMHADGG